MYLRGVARPSLAQVALALVISLVIGAGCTGSEASGPVGSNEAVSTDAVSNTGAVEEQAVIVELRLTGGGFGSDAERQKVFELEDKLIAAIEVQGVGEYDGNEFGRGGVMLYAYGPDADALFTAMETLLRDFAANQGSTATLRYGSADNPAARERVVPLP
jgi:hypothetical protein